MLAKIQRDILRLVERDGRLGIEAAAMQRASLKESLDLFEQERRARRLQFKVIESLYFPEIRRRWRQISDADHLTNTWLFDRTRTDFLDWLESGSGIYWISGIVSSPLPPLGYPAREACC